MDVAIVIAFYALVALAGFRIPRPYRAAVFVGFTALLAISLVVQATLAGTVGGYAALASAVAWAGAGTALWLGPGD